MRCQDSVSALSGRTFLAIIPMQHHRPCRGRGIARGRGLVCLSSGRASSVRFVVGDNDLEDAISGVSVGLTHRGHTASVDTFNKVLVLTTSSLGGSGCTLSGAYAVIVNETQGTAIVANIPTVAKVTSNDTGYALADLCAASGAASVIQPLFSATNVSFDHVIVTTSSVDDVLSRVGGHLWLFGRRLRHRHRPSSRRHRHRYERRLADYVRWRGQGRRRL